MNAGSPEDVAALRNYCVALARRHSPQDAEDYAQDAMVLALSSLHQFRPETGAGGLKAWLARIVTNARIERLRQAQAHARKMEKLRLFQSCASVMPCALDAIKLKETMMAITQLEPEDRSIIFMGIEMNNAEMATHLGETANNARKRLYRARRDLRRILADDQ